MAFKKRVYRKRTTKKPTLARQVAVIKRTLRTVKPEVKYYRTYGTQYLYQAGTLITPLKNITQGLSDYGNRVGDKIMLKNFKFRSLVELATAIPYANVRYILFQFKSNPDNVTSTASTIINFIAESATNNTTYFPFCFMDWDNKSAFRILKDTGPIVINNPNVGAGAYAREINVNVSFKGPSKAVEYFGGGTSIAKNELFLLCISNYASASINQLYDYQLSYTDN